MSVDAKINTNVWNKYKKNNEKITRQEWDSVSVDSRRSGKDTHISMISNSVTHLRSYTNTATTDIQCFMTILEFSFHRQQNNLGTYWRSLGIFGGA